MSSFRSRLLPSSTGPQNGCGQQHSTPMPHHATGARPCPHEIGAVDSLVNNAGILPAWPSDHYPDDQVDDILAVNLRTPVALLQRVPRAWCNGTRAGSSTSFRAGSGPRQPSGGERPPPRPRHYPTPPSLTGAAARPGAPPRCLDVVTPHHTKAWHMDKGTKSTEAVGSCGST